jgi:hypothetical protein
MKDVELAACPEVIFEAIAANHSQIGIVHLLPWAFPKITA